MVFQKNAFSRTMDGGKSPGGGGSTCGDPRGARGQNFCAVPRTRGDFIDCLLTHASMVRSHVDEMAHRNFLVELEGFEPSSRQSNQEPSTCLSSAWIFEVKAGAKANLPDP